MADLAAGTIGGLIRGPITHDVKVEVEVEVDHTDSQPRRANVL